ncbi:hypothetical protein FAK_23850 [Desulfoferula mesophila]|uniref:Uncharacterized protein n=1 Tax=Desulfoferula mesophila TaxID=3058419 RepID=A0AAU9ELA3_9BACT|nr:hypothetical protein FAK_23850 [Desulfoferula mesophilus]
MRAIHKRVGRLEKAVRGDRDVERRYEVFRQGLAEFFPGGKVSPSRTTGATGDDDVLRGVQDPELRRKLDEFLAPFQPTPGEEPGQP